MDEIPLSAQFAALAVLLVLSGFFAMAETAMMAANRHRLRHLADSGHRGARLAQTLLSQVDRLISMILLGNTLINAAAAMLTGHIALQVVEFAHGRVAMAQAFGKQLRGDGFHLLRRDVAREAVHQLAPGPETVQTIAGDFRHAAQRPLERMRMQVDHAGQDILGHFHAGRRCGIVPRSPRQRVG